MQVPESLKWNVYISFHLFMLNETMEHELVREDQANPLLMRTFSIIIPAYNEEKRIGPVLEEISSFISINRLPWDVVIAVDGNDRTEDIISAYNKNFPFIRSKKASSRSGMGGGIKRGILASTGDYFILMDGDGSANLHSIISRADLLNKYDIVNFNRYSDKDNQIPLKRRIASRSFNLMLRLIFGIHVSDTQCGYKMMKRSAVMPLIGKLTVSNAFFLSALFVYSRKYGVTVGEVPIRYNHSNGSKFNVVMTSISYIISITAFKIRNSKFYDYTPTFIRELYYKKLRYL